MFGGRDGMGWGEEAGGGLSERIHVKDLEVSLGRFGINEDTDRRRL